MRYRFKAVFELRTKFNRHWNLYQGCMAYDNYEGE